MNGLVSGKIFNLINFLVLCYSDTLILNNQYDHAAVAILITTYIVDSFHSVPSHNPLLFHPL